MKKRITRTFVTLLLVACMAIVMCATLVACGDLKPDTPDAPDTPDTPQVVGIATPTDFTITDNAYSFKGVEDASYYQIYFYVDADADDYDYALPSISASASKTTYTGKITTVPAGSYTVRLFAYDEDDEASAPAVIECNIVAQLSAPTIEYWYDAYLGKLDLQLLNFDVYQTESTPEVQVTLTDITDGNSEVKKSFTVADITAAYEKITGERSDYPYIEFDVEEEHTYSIKATAVAKSEFATSSQEVTSFESIELGKANKKSAGFDAVWSSNVVADSVAELDVTITEKILLSSINSTVDEIADGALMNFRYMQALDSGRKAGFKRDFGYQIEITKDAEAVEGCTISYKLEYLQGTNNGEGYLYLKEDGTVKFYLGAATTGVPTGGEFEGGWVYLDDEQTKVAVNISNDNLVKMFSSAN